jgi:hypothetical protein
MQVIDSIKRTQRGIKALDMDLLSHMRAKERVFGLYGHHEGEWIRS